MNDKRLLLPCLQIRIRYLIYLKNLPDLFQPIPDFRLSKKSYKIFYLSAHLFPLKKKKMLILTFALKDFLDLADTEPNAGKRKHF